MVVIVKTRNNTDALKAINTAKRALKVKSPRTTKQKQYVKNKMKYLNNYYLLLFKQIALKFS